MQSLQETIKNVIIHKSLNCRAPMKPSKTLLIMQLINLIATAVFMVVYTKWHIAMILAFLALLFIVTHNLYRYTKHLDIANYTLWGQLLISFFMYGFYGLGSLQAPQSFETMDTGHSTALFEFQTLQEIDKICYYVGIDDNVKFDITYKENNNWKQLYTYKENFPYSFRWRCIDKTVHTSAIKLHITHNSMMLNEVRFMHGDQQIQYITDRERLNDEPRIKIDTSYYGSMFFDELYHGRTAYEILHHLTIYETAHPHLGKVLIIPGIKLFGMTPFGWRFTNVLFGGFIIILIYLFGLALFGGQIYAFTVSLFTTYSFMHFTQSRIALIDTFGVFFVLLSSYLFYMFIKKQHITYLVLSGIAYGLASAVKWSSIFLAVGLLLATLYLIFSRYPLKKNYSSYKILLYGIGTHIFLAIAVYLATFFIFTDYTYHSLQAVIDYQFGMYDYHTTLKATHSYSSSWWEWITDAKPMCYYRQTEGNVFSSITVFGNPLLFWSGVIFMADFTYTTIKQSSIERVLVLSTFFGLYLPYIFIGRLMFIYHFYYALPFMFLGITAAWKSIIEDRKSYTPLLLMFALVTAGLFLLFFPVLSGHATTSDYVNTYLIWSKGWWL